MYYIYCLDLPELASIQLGLDSFPFVVQTVSDEIDTFLIMQG